MKENVVTIKVESYYQVKMKGSKIEFEGSLAKVSSDIERDISIIEPSFSKLKNSKIRSLGKIVEVEFHEE